MKQADVLFTALLGLRHGSRDVDRTVPSIVVSAVRRMARPAVAVTLARRPVAKAELMERLPLAACVAAPELPDRPYRELLDHGTSRGGRTSQSRSNECDLGGCQRTSPRILAPAELLCSTSAVAVRAAYVAFLDLPEDARPLVVSRQLADRQILLFRISVVEFEHRDLRAATVDTRVLAEVCIDERADARTLGGASPRALRQIRRAVLAVVLAPVLTTAVAAPNAAQTSRLDLHRELVDRLQPTATRAPARTVGNKSEHAGRFEKVEQ